MKKLHVLIPSLVATAGMPLISLASCGNGEEKKEDKIDRVEISGDQEVVKGEEATYSAEVTVLSGNPDRTVTWSITSGQDETGSTIDATTGKFTAGNKVGSVVIKATSVFDNKKTAEFTVNVVSAIKSVIINDIPDLEWNGGYTCQASVEGLEEYDKSVTWDIVEKGATATIVPDTGVLTAGEKTETITVRATSVVDPDIFGIKTVKVVSPIKSISVSDIPDLGLNCEWTCTAEVDSKEGYSRDVTWDIVEKGATATIVPDTGVLTAGEKTETITVRATSVVDKEIFGTKTVNILSCVKSVSINKQTQALPTGGVIDYNATVETTGQTSTDVKWEIIEGKDETGSSIDENTGEFTAGTTEGKVVIKATSIKEKDKFDTLDIYIQDECPCTIELKSDNAIVFGQSIVCSVSANPTIEGIYVATEVSCDVGGTGSTWDAQTNTLTAGDTAGSVTLSVKPLGYDTTTTYTIYVAQNIFKYTTSGTNATITGLADTKYTNVSVLPTISENEKQYNVTEIGEKAFDYEAIKTFNLKTATNLTKIGVNAFKNALIKSIYIPKTVTTIRTSAFDSSFLESVYIEEGSQLELNEADKYIFSGYNLSGAICLETINLENASKITCIPEDFIQFQPIKSITIPASVNTICKYAFHLCENLTTINFLGTINQWKAITRIGDWHNNVPTETVHCIDGDCGLDDTL